MQELAPWRKVGRSVTESRREAEALRLLGPGVVTLLAVENGDLLLERVVPGLPRQVVSAAREELDRLLSEPVTPMVLHGDLHHDNLLWSGGRGWVAIDPHGLVGDPGYDVGPLLRRP